MLMTGFLGSSLAAIPEPQKRPASGQRRARETPENGKRAVLGLPRAFRAIAVLRTLKGPRGGLAARPYHEAGSFLALVSLNGARACASPMDPKPHVWNASGIRHPRDKLPRDECQA